MTDDLRAFKGIALAVLLGAAIWLIAIYAANAQTPSQPSAEVRALQARLNDTNNQCNGYASAAFTLQDKLQAAEAEVKALKDKYEPEKKAPAKSP